MTPRERLLTVLAGRIPDCVPVAPDISNMVPARLTGKPFWDLYLYRDPPPWEAYLAAAKLFDIDSLMDGYFHLRLDDPLAPPEPAWETFIVSRADDRIVTQKSHVDSGKRVWAPLVNVYYRADPPTWDVSPDKAHLPLEPERFEPLEGVKGEDAGPTGLKRAKRLMGDQGLVGVTLTSSIPAYGEELVFRYYDHPEQQEAWAAERVAAAERRFELIVASGEMPDFFCVGASGTLVFQTVEMFRKISFPAVKRSIELASSVGIPTHVHSCGPEAALVKIMAEETDLTVIDPLEIPPMGDCDLAEIKRLYGDKIVLKGNLHTTDVMLRGTVQDVIAAAKRAIDDAGAGGRFILSTGDQCGRDTPDENLHALVETARTYGRYD